MARSLLRLGRRSACLGLARGSRSMVTASSSLDLDSDITLQAARTWDEGVETKFEKTPLSKIFKNKRVVAFGLPGAFTGVCSQSHVPSYVNAVDKIKSRGVDSVICVAVNDPYTLNAWAEKLKAKGKLEFYADYDASFHKSLGLECDLSAALLGLRAKRWSALVDDGIVKVLNVENAPSELKVSDGETMLKKL